MAKRLTRESVVELPSPTQGAEGSDTSAKVARFIISTDGESTDRNIVRQYWDLSRAASVGIPVLDCHNPKISVGRWANLTCRQDGVAPLTGEVTWNRHEPLGVQREAEYNDGFLNACSVRWIPGFSIRRSELPETDPCYMPAREDDCGFPDEGYVYGSSEEPNVILEASVTFLPADPRAVAIRSDAFGLEAGNVNESEIKRFFYAAGKSAATREILDRAASQLGYIKRSDLESILSSMGIRAVSSDRLPWE